MREATLRPYRPDLTALAVAVRSVCLVSYHVVRMKADPRLFKLKDVVCKRERVAVRRAQCTG